MTLNFGQGSPACRTQIASLRVEVVVGPWWPRRAELVPVCYPSPVSSASVSLNSPAQHRWSGHRVRALPHGNSTFPDSFGGPRQALPGCSTPPKWPRRPAWNMQLSASLRKRSAHWPIRVSPIFDRDFPLSRSTSVCLRLPRNQGCRNSRPIWAPSRAKIPSETAHFVPPNTTPVNPEQPA